MEKAAQNGQHPLGKKCNVCIEEEVVGTGRSHGAVFMLMGQS